MATFGEERFAAHVYLDHHYPPVIWNIVRGAFNSCENFPESKETPLVSISMATMLLNSNADRLLSEYALDSIREKHYSENVSRLTGVFVFDDLESLNRLWNNNDWGGHFQDEYLADVGIEAVRSSRVDSNWISSIIDENGRLTDSWEACAHSYWKGDVFPGKDPIWESIIEGKVTILSKPTREEALKELESMWPQSLNLLRYSILCAQFQALDGQIYPLLLRNSNSFKLSYYLRMKQRKDQEFIDELNDFIEKNPQCNTSISCVGQEVAPDLTGFSVELTPSTVGGFGALVETTLNSNVPSY